MSEIVVHHLIYSRSLRVLWMLEEMDTPYTLREYHRDENFRAPKSLEAIHPLGRAPVLEMDGRVLAESGAILEALADRAPELRPEAGSPALQDYRFWMHYAEGSLMPPLLIRLLIDQVRHAKVPFFIKPITRQIAQKVDDAYTDDQLERQLRFVDAHLASRAFFVGDSLTAADIQMVYAVEAGLGRGRVPDLPHAAAWLERMQARPAFQRAVDKGGPALPER